MITNLSNVSVAQLKRAVVVREQIESLERELAGILGESQSVSHEVSTNGHGGRRKMSPAARAKIAAAQRARWAKQKKGQPKTATVAVKGRRKMSPAARAKIAAAARARWAKAKAANRRTLAAA
jgi:hypothetical protein